MKYLKVEDIIRINKKLIAETSRGELIGIKDAAALDMAINQPKQIVFGHDLYPPIYDKAAILTINLAKRHPFQNANKRTALVAMLVFFSMNGYSTHFDRQEAVQFILTITTSDQDFDALKRNVTLFLKNQIRYIANLNK
ncbi:type II toxin-antitoxin system death-on-curing family toxin [Enterococcus sp. RIT-PI-f]|uniref:type II toxin-antitoxin system death-on-curing family toxin n=1 Tax=Enterococcus sp. RIT-PI-f TaxID=1690244 RepID=UPI0006B9DCA0|nr:type II toxin-antitoxin system death-on-curing family toxin [Enterococcus sp. RIT-PI-f]KPG70439.1 cytochrome C biogenesis protein CcmI [Enterococcus sp. RIT-PI-f]